MRGALAISFVAIAMIAAGCGGDDDSVESARVVPAAGELTPPARPAGVPAGATYDLLGNEYLKLSTEKATKAATDFVDDNPDECEGADPKRVAAYSTTSVGIDYPLTEPIAELLAEGCAADLQSG